MKFLIVSNEHTSSAIITAVWYRQVFPECLRVQINYSNYTGHEHSFYYKNNLRIHRISVGIDEISDEREHVIIMSEDEEESQMLEGEMFQRNDQHSCSLVILFVPPTITSAKVKR